MPQQHSDKHGDHFADVGTQQEANHLFDIGVDATTFPDGIHDGSKVIIGQGHIRSTLGNIRTGDAHSAADICSLQCRRIINTVTGHRNHLTLALPGFDDADLILRRYTGIYGDIFHLGIQFRIRHSIQFATGDRLVAGK